MRGWLLLSPGLDAPRREPWQTWPVTVEPVVYAVWSVTQLDPLRLGSPHGTIWLDVDAAHAEAEARDTLRVTRPRG